MRPLIAAFAVLICSACASVQRDPLYDGGAPIAEQETAAAPSDSVLVTIENRRSRELTDPVFYLVGNGRHSLGRVPGLSTGRVFVDSRWLMGADGTFQIYVHYVGGEDLYYQKTTWFPGQSISVDLGTLFNYVAAWAHR